MKTERIKLLEKVAKGEITPEQADNKLLVLYGVMPRFFVDLRSGCGAVRDRLHPNYDPEYQGLHSDTIDVIEYRHGFQNHEKNCWDMKQDDVDFLNERCDSLNEA